MASEQLLQDHVAEIQAIGRRLASLKASREALYDAVRGLDHGTAQALKESNEKAAMAARPVNLVRYEILRRVLAGEEVDATGTERLQDAIVRREESAFPGYPEAFYQQLRAADIKANAFRNWKDHFRLFYSFFYSGEDRDRVPKVLDEICDGTKERVETRRPWSRHNFGDTSCWLAVSPREKTSHKTAYQLFVGISPTSVRYGIHPGSLVARGNASFKLNNGKTLREAVNHFHDNRERYVRLNKELVTI